MRNKKFITIFLSSIIILLIIFCVALMVGRYSIPISNFFKAIFTNDAAFLKDRNVIINLRLPRTIVAGLTGIALSISGLLYQETFQNKLVSPDLLGVSSGAGVGAAIAIVAGLSTLWINVFAFLIAVGTVILVFLIYKTFRNSSNIILILSGVIIGGLMTSILALIKYISGADSQLTTITYWLMGSFEKSNMTTVYVLLPIVALCITILIILRWRINIIALGEEEATAKGLNYKFYRLLIIIIATLLTATSVSFSGTISLVGLIIPHIVRLIVGRDTRVSIPFTITFGAIFMIFIDIMSRSFTQQEIPLSALTGSIGSVVFIILLIKNRGTYYGN